MKDSIPGIQNLLKLERKNPKEKSQTKQRKRYSQLNILNSKTHDQSTSKEKLKELNDDIEKLYKKYSQVKKERLMKEKSQQILVNRIKVLKHQESSSRNKESMQNTFRLSENENKIHVTINSRYKNNNNLLKKFKNYGKKHNFSNDSGIKDSNDRTANNYNVINSISNFNNTFDRSNHSIGIGNTTNSIDNSALNLMNNENINLNNINELLKRYNIGNKNSNNNIYIIINNPNNNFSDNKIIKNSSDDKNKNNIFDNDKPQDQSNNIDNTKENINKDFNLGNDKKGENIILMNTDGKKIEDIINSISNINNSNINNNNIININESNMNNIANDNKINLNSDVNKENNTNLKELNKEDKNNDNNKNDIIDEHNNNIEVSSIKNENSNLENNLNKDNNENKENNRNQNIENTNLSNNRDINNNLNEENINIVQHEKSDNKDNSFNNLKIKEKEKEDDDKEKNNLIKNNVDDDNNINNNCKKEDKQSRPNFLDLYNNDITNTIAKQKIDIKSFHNSNITENSENKTEKYLNESNNEQNNVDKNNNYNANKDENNENEKENKSNNYSVKKIIYHKYNNSTRIQPKKDYSSLVVHSTPNENKIRKKVIVSNNNINKIGQNESNFVYLKKRKLEDMYNFSTKSELRIPETRTKNNKLFNIINKTIKVEGNKTQKKLESLNTNLYTPTKLQNNNLLKVNKRPDRTFTNIQRTKNNKKYKNINLRGRKNNDLMNYSLSYKSFNNNSNYLSNSHSSINYNTQRNSNFEKIRKNNFKKDAYCTSIEKKRKALGLQCKLNLDKELCIENEKNNYNKKMFDKIKNYKINKKGIDYKNIGDINKLIIVNKRDDGNDINDNMNNNMNLEGINATSKRFRIIKKNYVKDKHIFSKNKTTTNFNYVHSDINNNLRNKKLSENTISNSSSLFNDSSNLYFDKSKASNFI